MCYVINKDFLRHLKQHGYKGKLVDLKRPRQVTYFCVLCGEHRNWHIRGKHFRNKHPDHMTELKEIEARRRGGASDMNQTNRELDGEHNTQVTSEDLAEKSMTRNYIWPIDQTAMPDIHDEASMEWTAITMGLDAIHGFDDSTILDDTFTSLVDTSFYPQEGVGDAIPLPLDSLGDEHSRPDSREPTVGNHTHSQEEANQQRMSVESNRQAYAHTMRLAMSEARGYLKEMNRRYGNTKTRLASMLEEYLPVMESCNVIAPMSFWEYEEATASGQSVTGQFLYLDEDQAEELLRRGPLRIAFVVPHVLKRRRRKGVSIQQYGQTLRGFEDVFFHDLLVKPTESYAYPKKMKGNDVADLLAEHLHSTTSRGEPIDANGATVDRLPEDVRFINILDLASTRTNSVPDFMADLDIYDVLVTVKEANSSGKVSTTNQRDLSACALFEILGTKGVFSLPHVDHHGVVTSITCEQGRKLWPMWAWMDPLALERLSALGELPGDSFCVFLGPGDTLVQPAGTLHAPFCVDATLMSGTMHWNSEDMGRTMYLSWLEQIDPTLTNEEPAKEFKNKITRIKKMMEGGSQFRSWGSPSQLPMFREYYDVS